MTVTRIRVQDVVQSNLTRETEKVHAHALICVRLRFVCYVTVCVKHNCSYYMADRFRVL